MALFKTLARLQTAVGVNLTKADAGDPSVNYEQRIKEIEEAARGKRAPDLARDLASHTDASFEGAKGVDHILTSFNPQRTANQVAARLANVDGVAVPDQPIFKGGTSVRDTIGIVKTQFADGQEFVVKVFHPRNTKRYL